MQNQEITQKQIAAYHRQIEDTIEKYGYFIQGVFPTEDDDCIPFAYTIGLAQSRGYELICVGGVGSATMSSILNSTVVALSKRDSWVDGLLLDEILGEGFLVKIVEATDPAVYTEYAIGAVRRTERTLAEGQTFPIWQILLPDAAGVFPDEEGYNTDFAQTLLKAK